MRRIDWLPLIAIVSVVAVVVAIFAANPPSCAEASNDCTYQQVYKFVWEVIFSSGFWTAAFTGALTISTILLWRTTSDTLDHARTDAERQSRETQQQIELARKQFIATHRPKVILRFIQMGTLVSEKEPSIWLNIANTGSTDATVVTFEADFAIKKDRRIGWEPPGVVPVPVGLDSPVISNGARRSVQLRTGKVLTEDEVTKLRRLESQLYVMGRIRYRDGNDTIRETSFIRWHDAQFGRFQTVPKEWADSEFEYAD